MANCPAVQSVCAAKVSAEREGGKCGIAGRADMRDVCDFERVAAEDELAEGDGKCD